MPIQCWCGNREFDEFSEYYYICKECQTLVSKNKFDTSIYHIENEESDLYGKNYWEKVMVEETKVDSIDSLVDLYIRERCVYWLKYILQYIPLDKKVAEIGCGLGQLAYMMKKVGYQQKAFEISPSICQYIKKTMNINVFCGELKECTDKFDVFLAFDLFEHLTEPKQFLEEINRHSESETVLVLQMPCYDRHLSYSDMLNRQSRFLKLLVPEQHVYIYNKESIKNLLSKYGFEYISFEQPFFGEDYDMFLFASNVPISKISERDVAELLNRQDNGRLIKSIISLFNDKLDNQKYIETLETRNNVLQKACDERLGLINQLDNRLKKISLFKIGVSITNLYPGKNGGLEQYTRNLISEMNKCEGIKLYVFTNSIAHRTFESNKNVTVLEVNEFEDRDTQLNFYIDYYCIDILFSPLFFIAPDECSIPAVVTIPDIQHEFYPEYFAKTVLRDIRKQINETINKASGIITISEYSKNTICKHFKKNASEVMVTYLNSDSSLEDFSDIEVMNKIKNSIGGEYAYYPANTWPHKNHINLLKAFVILKLKYGSKLKLVLTGDHKQQSEIIKKIVKENNMEKDVIQLGYLRQEEIPYYYKCAKMLVFPSLFEGFGIPIVEAMRAEIPIVCSECGSIPEIAGDAALYFDAKNPEDMADKIHLLAEDKNLYDNLVEKGKRQVEKFSWKICSDNTIEYLKKICFENRKDIIKNETEEGFPLVSIVTPSYNQGEFIRDTIESVLMQSYPNIEYIVVDGGSTDSTVSILKSYGNRVKWISEKDEGQADAINKGIKMARGKIIGWINSDDTYMENAVEKAVTYFRLHPITDLVYGEGYYIDKKGNRTERYRTEKYSRERLAQACIICQPTAFFKKQIIEKVNYLDKRYQLSMDYELWMRIAKVGKISYIPEYLANSRMYDENKTCSRRKEIYLETISAVKKHYGYVPISWIDGYADWICNGQNNLKYTCINLSLFILHNYKNYKYCIKNVNFILKNRLYSIIHKPCFEGKYQDGWIGKKYVEQIDIVNSLKHIVISGNNNWPKKNKKLHICIKIDDLIIKKIEILQRGNFTEKIVINECIGSGSHYVTIECDESFCPARILKNNDNRILTFQLDSIEYIGD